MEIENKRRFSLFVLLVDFLVDSIPATMMIWLLVFCKIDVNCQLQANGKQMLSRKKLQVHTQPATLGFLLLCQGCHICMEQGTLSHRAGKKRILCYLIFYWFGNYWDQALAHLDQSCFISCTWEHFQSRQQGHSWECHTLAQVQTL